MGLVTDAGRRVAAERSVGAGLAVAAHSPAVLRVPIADAVRRAFMSGLHTGSLVAAGVCFVGALGALALPGRAPKRAPEVLLAPNGAA